MSAETDMAIAAELRRLIAAIDGKRLTTGAQRYCDGWFDGSSMAYDLLCDRVDEIELESRPLMSGKGLTGPEAGRRARETGKTVRDRYGVLHDGKAG